MTLFGPPLRLSERSLDPLEAVLTRVVEDTRTRILGAARELLVQRGLTGCTTREIARKAGVAEGTIYNHFADKFDLCLAVLVERSRLPRVLEGLQETAGARPVRDVLRDVVDAWLELLGELIPMLSGVIGHPDLAELHRNRLTDSDDPLAGTRLVAEYLEAERAAGRVGVEGDCFIAARVLFGTGFHQVYLELLLGREAVRPTGPAFVDGLVDMTLASLGPPSRPRVKPRTAR